MILEKLEGSFTDEYNKLDAYANAIKKSNVGSDIINNISKDALAEGKKIFLRMYICFEAMKKGFKGGLRTFVVLDETFLEEKAKGELLVAVAQNAMNHFYPFAWTVKSLDLKNGEGVTFISDMQKGLLDAIQSILPDTHYRYCVRHTVSNWSKEGHGYGERTKLVWWCAWRSYEEELNDHLKTLGEISEEGVKDLLHYPVKCWCRTYFDTVFKNQKVENNLNESFNSWILDARHKLIIGMLQEIRIKVMNILSKKESNVMTWPTQRIPQEIELYNEYLRIPHKCTIDFHGEYGYEFSKDGEYGQATKGDQQ
ncbi:PREDICTED: uncharacterized protein LOC109207152 [Nicotiana attenuata]|uniref:uncharacterized protein LOC109207152 n=1 Tax=Nicotiana attenuata TaxID=49451 RepID=UPI0009049242|nr:PREDICTED: uncharacterized protein LOC109207152 [Nicotiana attenuata]